MATTLEGFPFLEASAGTVVIEKSPSPLKALISMIRKEAKS